MSQPPNHKQGTRIKVLRIIARMNVGGPAVQITSLMKGLNQIEFDHKLVTGFCEEDEIDYLEASAKDVPVERVHGLGRSVNLFSDVVSIFRIIKIIRKFKPDIVHTHTAKAGVVGRIASLLSGHKSKRIHTFHGHVLQGYFSKNKTRLYVYVEIVLSFITHKFVCVGTKVRNDLIAAGIGRRNKYVVFPPGVLKPSIFEKEKAAIRLGVLPNKIYCLFLGRVTQIKRPDRLIKVASILSSRNVEVTFLIAGGGDLLDEMRNASEKLKLPMIFLGWQHDLDALFSVADLLVMTSDNEGTPLSIIQAQLSGIPVVSTNVGSVSEILLNHKSAFLTNVEANQIAEKIEILIKSPGERERMGAEGILFASNKFSPERLVRDHQELYKEILTNPANS
jgi:glycosyltransferase involved in cell wall biosynthesis